MEVRMPTPDKRIMLSLWISCTITVLLIGCGVTDTSPETVIDYDGNIYTTVRIGNQLWTVENLRVTHYNDGTPIPRLTESTEWEQDSTGAYCYYDNDSASNAKKYGCLYNWYVVDTKKLAPVGWHIPTKAEWDTLETHCTDSGYGYQGSGNDIAPAMAAENEWEASGVQGTPGDTAIIGNSSGFSALPGGSRSDDGVFFAMNFYGNWWTATGTHEQYATYTHIQYHEPTLNGGDAHKRSGFSVRLVKDAH